MIPFSQETITVASSHINAFSHVTTSHIYFLASDHLRCILVCLLSRKQPPPSHPRVSIILPAITSIASSYVYFLANDHLRRICVSLSTFSQATPSVASLYVFFLASVNLHRFLAHLLSWNHLRWTLSRKRPPPSHPLTSTFSRATTSVASAPISFMASANFHRF